MRTISTAGATALSNAVVCMAMLVEMDLTQPLNLNTSSLSLVLGGVTYSGVGGLGQIDAITESSGDLPRLNFSLAGVQPSAISLALSEPVQGAAVRIKMAVFDSATGAPIDVRQRYAGYLDVMSVSDGKDSATLSVSSESAMLDLIRPTGIYYNDIDQQALNPGDLAFQYVNDQVDQKIVWPSAKFFEKH
jgi:hypothetical protein